MILIGDSGTGKTHLATALAVCACQARTPRPLHHPRRPRQRAPRSRRRAASSPASSPATPAPSSSSLTSSATSRLPDGAAELVFQVLSERHERGIADRHHQPPLRRMDEGLPRPPARQSRRRPAHPPRPHHRHRHRILALPPRPHPEQTPPTDTSPHDPDRAALPPLRSPTARSGTAARRTISYQSKDRKPDGGWGHGDGRALDRGDGGGRAAARRPRPSFSGGF